VLNLKNPRLVRLCWCKTAV